MSGQKGSESQQGESALPWQAWDPERPGKDRQTDAQRQTDPDHLLRPPWVRTQSERQPGDLRNQREYKQDCARQEGCVETSHRANMPICVMA